MNWDASCKPDTRDRERERDTEERDTGGTYIDKEITHDKQKKTHKQGDIGETQTRLNTTKLIITIQELNIFQI